MGARYVDMNRPPQSDPLPGLPTLCHSHSTSEPSWNGTFLSCFSTPLYTLLSSCASFPSKNLSNTQCQFYFLWAAPPDSLAGI